jgi:hypothetical protein
MIVKMLGCGLIRGQRYVGPAMKLKKRSTPLVGPNQKGHKIRRAALGRWYVSGNTKMRFYGLCDLRCFRRFPERATIFIIGIYKYFGT